MLPPLLLPLCSPLSLELPVFPSHCWPPVHSFSESSSVPTPGLPCLLPILPQGLPWPIPSHYSAPSSDVTFSETQLPSWVAQPSLVTHTSHHHIFSAFSSFSTYHYLKKSFLFVYFWFSSNGSSLRSGSSSVLLTVVSAIPRSVFNKYLSRSWIFTTFQQARHHCHHLPDEETTAQGG